MASNEAFCGDVSVSNQRAAESLSSIPKTAICEDIQRLTESTDQPNLEITVLANTQDMLRHSHVTIKHYP